MRAWRLVKQGCLRRVFVHTASTLPLLCRRVLPFRVDIAYVYLLVPYEGIVELSLQHVIALI
jgi:hypothetical protein